MQCVTVTIKGVSPLLMNRYRAEQVEAFEKKQPDEQARLALYEQDGRPFVPGVNLQRALVAGATFSKGKGRSTLQRAAAACLLVNEAQVPLHEGAQWVRDDRPVTIPATRGRVMRHRPRFDDWQLTFTLSYDETLLSEQQIRRIVDDTGSRVGVLDFRPEKKGPFGRFIVMKWEA